MSSWYVIRHLGVRWAVFRLLYALKRRTGYFERRLPARDWSTRFHAAYLTDPSLTSPEEYLAYRRAGTPVFLTNIAGNHDAAQMFTQWDGKTASPLIEADELLAGRFRFYRHITICTGFPPAWYTNPFTGEIVPPQKHWSRLSDSAYGDIKHIWELGRFGFAFTLARAYARTLDERYAEAFWTLIEDWRRNNPPHVGPHWMCGQEVAFRVIAWCFALQVFLAARATTARRVAALAEMVAVSAERIAANLAYALSQNNNHGISEAVGLWTVSLLFPEFRESRRWLELGRRHLEKQGLRLIHADGTFAQHSVSYHRLMLHDYIWAYVVGHVTGYNFNAELLARLRRATEFLAAVTDAETGHAPLLGANDGSLVLPLNNCDYLDFRPSVQAASALWQEKRRFPPGPWDEDLLWLGAPAHSAYNTKQTNSPSHPLTFDDGGIIVMRCGPARAYIRCTKRYRFRPSHADQLHVDFWYNGLNVLRDGGSFSYNSHLWHSYFTGTEAHNTVQFDSYDQMPRVSRFLFAEWLSVVSVVPLTTTEDGALWRGCYTDWRRCRHERQVECQHNGREWFIWDNVAGYRDNALLRWRLAPEGHWVLDENLCKWTATAITLEIRILDGEAAAIRLANGWESRYYGEKTPLPVLQVDLRPPHAKVLTVIRVG